MLFDDEARVKLDAIIHGSAVGETVGILASRMSKAERAERLTPEGILQLSRQSDLTSTTAQLLKATVTGLEAADAMGTPSNLEIRIQLHHAYREWVKTSSAASQFRNIHLTRAIQTGPVGSLTSAERGGCDGMLIVAPIGLAFSNDPGRAFQIGAEAAAIIDADFNSNLSAGVVSLLFALTELGMTTGESIADVLTFIRPLDWPGEVSNVLRSATDTETLKAPYCHPACSTLAVALGVGPSAGIHPEAVLTSYSETSGHSTPALVGQLAYEATWANRCHARSECPVDVGCSKLEAV